MDLEKITKEEFEKSEGKATYVGRPKNPFWVVIRSLEVDYGVKIWRKDWQRKTDPIALILSNLRKEREKDKKFTCKTLANNEGWLVLRIK